MSTSVAQVADDNAATSSFSISSQGSTNGSISSPNVGSSLRRVSTPRRNKTEDMSISDFFKYTIMMREQDRKDREEREREERIERESENRMFRELILAALVSEKKKPNNEYV